MVHRIAVESESFAMASKDSKRTTPRKTVTSTTKKTAPKSAGKSASKRVPKKITSAPVTATAKELQQRTKNLTALSKQLATAQRSASNSRKPDSIKAATRFLKSAQREYNKELRQTVKTANALEKFIDVFKSRGRKVKPAQKATLTKAKKIVTQVAPVKRVPKKKVAVTKVAPKGATKPATKKPAKVPAKKAAKKTTTKKATKPAAKTAKKRVPKTTPAPAKQYQFKRSKGFHELPAVTKQVMTGTPTYDGKDLLDKGERFSATIKGHKTHDSFATLFDLYDAVTEYNTRGTPKNIIKVGVFSTHMNAPAKEYKAQIEETRRLRAERKASELAQTQSELAAAKQRIKELEKQFKVKDKE